LEYRVLYHPGIKKDLKNINKKFIDKFFDIINTQLVFNPYIGKKLRGKYSDLWRFRIGTYRIIYSIDKEKLKILILRFRHRKDAYSFEIS
jgi:mRNA interferase RelE/StbE